MLQVSKCETCKARELTLHMVLEDTRVARELREGFLLGDLASAHLLDENEGRDVVLGTLMLGHEKLVTYQFGETAVLVAVLLLRGAVLAHAPLTSTRTLALLLLERLRSLALGEGLVRRA